MTAADPAHAPAPGAPATLSIVVPVYNEEAVLPEFHRRLAAVLDGLPGDAEIIYVNDGSRIETVDEGWVWVFAAVDHFDACCVGIHAVKTGNRFAALQPIAQGLQAEFGATGADAGRGLTLRMDHGTQYTADDFLNQIKFWGIAPSFAFVAEPQTNGVAERFNRTLKEQVIHGRVFKNVGEVRAAVTAFKDLCNRRWRLEKLGFMSPLEARQAHALRKAA